MINGSDYLNAYIKTLKDYNGDIVYPQTKAEAIYDEQGNKLKDIMINIQISATQPSDQKVGDLWFQII